MTTPSAFRPPAVTSVRLSSDKRHLTVSFKDGFEAQLSAELLRVESPSAEVQGHGIDQKQIVRDKQDICITKIEPVGRYAVRLIFDDGHDTGLYSWALFYDYGKRSDEMMAAYHEALAKGATSH
jgi:DUF971 family protein